MSSQLGTRKPESKSPGEGRFRDGQLGFKWASLVRDPDGDAIEIEEK